MLKRCRRQTYAILTTMVLLYPTLSPAKGWQIGPFERVDQANPVLTPSTKSEFLCPVQDKLVRWEGEHIFNPAAVVRDGKVYLLYRAEDDYGEGVGFHTSRIGLAVSDDGLNFVRMPKPVLYPDNDDQKANEFPGGCEDPRIVQTEEGTYVLTYTQWNRKLAVLAIATSNDLRHWKKHGYAFEKDKNVERIWSKSGSIVSRREGDKVIATKINGKYWMYWGELHLYVATSDDLISWTHVLGADGKPLQVMSPRKEQFDSELVEPGPPALITKDGIVLLFNGKNSKDHGDPKVTKGAYSPGQVLLDLKDPTKLIKRSDTYFMTPERPYEMKGQYEGGTVFIEGLVPFQDHWFLYYGAADSAIGVAKSKKRIKAPK